MYVLAERQPEVDCALIAKIMAGLPDAPAVAGIAAGASMSEADRRALLDFLLDEYNARATLVLAHGDALCQPGGAGFDGADPDCALAGEVGAIARIDGGLRAGLPRLAAAERAADEVLPQTVPEALVLGAGPDGVAFALALADGRCAAKPDRVTLAGADAKALSGLRERIADHPAAGCIELRHVAAPGEHDRLLALLPPGSAVVAALGEARRPGAVRSPLGGGALFPPNAIIWDLHAQDTATGLLAEAARQRRTSHLTLADGTAWRRAFWREAAAALAGAGEDAAMRAKIDEGVDAALRG